jgi:hypothetical protein
VDILEQGPERPVSPLRRRAATGVVVAVAVGIVVARHHPGTPTTPPPPVAVSPAPAPTAPTPTGPTTGPTPAPSTPGLPDAALLARPLLPCDWFLAELALPKLDKWHATVVSTTRVANTQTRTYRRSGGDIRVSAGCGPIKWVLPLGQPDDTNVYVEYPSTGHAATAVWRADGAAGWYRIESDGPHGSVLSAAELRKLMHAIDTDAKTV